MRCPRRGRSEQFEPEDVLAMMFVRHHMTLEHLDSPGGHCVSTWEPGMSWHTLVRGS